MGRYSIRAAALAAAVLVAVCAPGARAASTAVTGLTAAQPVTNIAPSLHWNAFTGATAYRVVRDASLLTFTDATAGEGTHGYSVRAEDRAGNQAVAVSPRCADHGRPHGAGRAGRPDRDRVGDERRAQLAAGGGHVRNRDLPGAARRAAGIVDGCDKASIWGG